MDASLSDDGMLPTGLRDSRVEVVTFLYRTNSTVSYKMLYSIVVH